MVPLVANGTIGNQRTLNVSRKPMVPLVPMLPLMETLVPMVPLVVPPLVSPMVSTVIYIMINTSSLFNILIFYVHISVFLLFAIIIRIKTVLICEIYKFKV